MTILVVYSEEPDFPATDQNPDAVRYQVGNIWVDAIGDEPTQDDVDDVLHPVVAPLPPHLNYGGLARFSGTSPVTILEAIRMAGVTRVSKGRYRVSHETPMPSDQYSVMPSVMDPLPRTIRVTARTASYVEIRVTDLAGVAQDPAEAIVKTERVISS